MPYPDPFLSLLLVAVLASGVSFDAFKVIGWTSSAAREAHTELLFAQISHHLETNEDGTFPRMIPELLGRLQSASIDWNACRLSESKISDAWGRAIQGSADPVSGAWAFSSAGRDGKFNSSDDLVGRSIPPTRDP